MRKNHVSKAANEQSLTAQVLVRSKSGKQIDGTTPITSENIREYEPSVEDVAVVRTAFQSAGFQVANLVGISFSITATPKTFEAFFSTKLRFRTKTGIEVVDSRSPTGYELPLTALPPSLAERVVAITFSPPADFYKADNLML